MGEFIIGCALGFVFIACIAAPFLAPWRMRVRYLVNAQVADPVFGVGPPRDVALREVKLTAVDADRGHVDLVVENVGGAPQSRRRGLTGESVPPATVAKLDGWSATHELLLMVVDESGDIHLFVPNGAVTHLTRADERRDEPVASNLESAPAPQSRPTTRPARKDAVVMRRDGTRNA